MKAKNIFPALLIACISLTASCSSDSPSDGIKKGKENQAAPISNKQVGVSNFGDSISDKKWSERTDWDIAICGDLIRTNSGASGIGQGGIQESAEDYSTLKQAPETGYSTDVYE